MDLPASVTDSLPHLASLEKQRFSELVDLVFQGLLEDVSPTSNDPLDKILIASLMTVVIESYSQNIGPAYVSTFLEEKGITADQKEIFKKKFEEHSEQLKEQLKCLVPQRDPSVVDVEWKLNYLTKSSGLEKEEELSYIIKLMTLRDESSESLETEDIQFTCSMHQLQDLLAKLKEAYKNVEKLATLTNL